MPGLRPISGLKPEVFRQVTKYPSTQKFSINSAAPHTPQLTQPSANSHTYRTAPHTLRGAASLPSTSAGPVIGPANPARRYFFRAAFFAARRCARFPPDAATFAPAEAPALLELPASSELEE